jgi:hypothetical protein
MRALIAPLIGALLLTGCGGSSLEADDPAGYQACRIYAESREIEDDPLMRMGALLRAGEQARRADTKEIRAAAQEVAGSWIADGEALATACADNAAS